MRRGLLLPAVLLVACARPTPAPAPPVEPARRLVLALDGIDYRDVLTAREAGLFAGFLPPSRLVSTFPSISDIAWHDILGVLPPKGYQRVYYSHAFNELIGGALDAIRPIEYEERMDLAFGSKFHHLSAYVISDRVARHEVSDVAAQFFRLGGRRTVYAYNVGPDALQHTRGDLPGYLRHLDAELVALEAEYRRRTGRALEIVLLSDHGHNGALEAPFLDVRGHLARHGFHARNRLERPTDVAFSVDGVTTGFGVFCDPDSAVRVAELLAGLDGIEVVSARVAPGRHLVRAGGATAWIESRIEGQGAEAREAYRYLPASGDPLEHAAALGRMRAAGVADSAGWADARAWTAHTATDRFPAAVVRIARGHERVTLNAAPVLVSVDERHRVGLGMVSLANRLRPLGGTHGGLGAASSLGVLMTNFTPTHDLLTSEVRALFGGFDDLPAPPWWRAGGVLTAWPLLDGDPRSPFGGGRAATGADAAAADDRATPPAGPTAHGDASAARLVRDAGGMVGVAVSLSPEQVAWAGDRIGFVVELRRSRGTARGEEVVGRRVDPAAAWRMSPDGLHFFAPLAWTDSLPLAPSSRAYRLRVHVARLDPAPAAGGASVVGSVPAAPAPPPAAQRDVAHLSVRTTPAGRLAAY